MNKACIQPRRFLRRAGALALLAPLFLAACSEQKPAPKGPQTVPVTVTNVVQKSVPLQLTSIGTVEAYSTVAIKAMVNGQITGMDFTEGQDVKQGQLLFTIDARPYEAALQQAIATLAKDEAQLANARAQSARYQELQRQGVVAREQAESVVTNAQALEATVNADKASVDAARVQLQYCKIYAPISGRTGNVTVKMGNIVHASDAQGLVTINQVSPIYANFTVPEQALPDIKRYMAEGKLTVQAVAPNEPPVEGTLTFVDNSVDPTTGTIHLKATFENARRYLWPGQFVNTVLTLSTQPNATVIPSQAVQNGQQGTYVYVLKQDKTTELRNIVLARTIGQEAIVKSGLQPGETVITDGQLRLVPGARVDIKSAAAAPAPADSAQPRPAVREAQGATKDTSDGAPHQSREASKTRSASANPIGDSSRPSSRSSRQEVGQ